MKMKSLGFTTWIEENYSREELEKAVKKLRNMKSLAKDKSLKDKFIKEAKECKSLIKDFTSLHKEIVYNHKLYGEKTFILDNENKVDDFKKFKTSLTKFIQEKRSELRKPNVYTKALQDGTVIKLFGKQGKGVHQEKEAILELMARKHITELRRNKIPRGNDEKNYIGIEIEMFTNKGGRDEVERKMVKWGLHKYCSTRNDASIHPPTEGDYRGLEITTLIEESKLEERLKLLCDFLNKELNAKVNKSCGLHVHLDMRNRDVKKSFHNLVSCEDILYNMQPKFRRSNDYCRKQSSRNFDTANGNHYDGVSKDAYGKYRTLELRMHTPTTNYRKIYNWIDLLRTICDRERAMANKPKTLDELSKKVTLRKDLYDYIEERIEKFKKSDKEEELLTA